MHDRTFRTSLNVIFTSIASTLTQPSSSVINSLTTDKIVVSRLRHFIQYKVPTMVEIYCKPFGRNAMLQYCCVFFFFLSSSNV